MIAVSVARKSQLVGIALGLALITCLDACQLETEPDNSAPGEIVSFDFSKKDNPRLPRDAAGNLVDDSITINVPADSDVTSLVPTIQYKGAQVQPASGVAQDFTEPVTYKVTTPEGRERTYTVIVVQAADSSKDISRFVIDGVEATISDANITLVLPFGTDLTMLRASVVHTGESVRPESRSAQDFSEPVEYVVTARDGTTKSYTVFVSVAPSDAKDIIGFTIADAMAEIDGTMITVSLPFGTELQALKPKITHTGVRVTPASGSAQDFREPVTYSVTAADGSTQRYTVVVSVTPSDAKAITRFTIAGREASISGTAITITLPFGADLEHLVPTVQHTGKSVSPASGREQDFRQPVQYTVTAADGSSARYTVTISVAPDTAKEITAFEILGSSAQISGTDITLVLPFGTARSALIPTISYTGANLQPASGVARDFTDPVSYLVTAADGSTRSYLVTVSTALSDAKAITQFRLAGVQANIANQAISVTVPFGTDLSSITPVITHTGASISPGSSVALDFRQPVTYMVTAADGSSVTYTVTATVAKNNAKDITSFRILDIAATIGTNAIMLTVPFGTSVSGLVPTIVHEGVSINPASGVAQNFSSPVNYRVTAEDDTTKNYLVTVTVAPNSAKAISAFSINGVAGQITGTEISLTLPHGTDRSMLTPAITHTGQSLNPLSGTPQNFTNPVIYRVTAEDSTFTEYTVTVTLAANSAKEITAFELPAAQTTITSDAISVTVPNGTSVTALAPVITISGASVAPASGEPQDFTNPVVYTVTAEDSSTKQFTVTVTVAPP